MKLKVSLNGQDTHEFDGAMSDWVEIDKTQNTVAYFAAGPAHGHVKLSHAELVRLVTANAPCGSGARKMFFHGLVGDVEKLSPCSY